MPRRNYCVRYVYLFFFLHHIVERLLILLECFFLAYKFEI